MRNMGKNNKSNKNQDLERGEAKKGTETSSIFFKKRKSNKDFSW